MDAVSVVGLLVLWLVGYWTYKYVKFRLNPLYHAPAVPMGIPVVSVMKQLAYEEATAPMLRWTKTYGDFAIYFPWIWTPAVLTTSKEAVKCVMVEKEEKFTRTRLSRAILYDIVGDGLLLSNEDMHARQRKLLAPVFSPSNLPKFISIFIQKSNEVADRWEEKIKSSGDDHIVESGYSTAASVAMDIIGLAAFGYNFQAVAKNEKASAVSRAANDLVSPMITAAGRLLILLLSTISPMLSVWVIPGRAKNIRTVRRAVREVIQARRKDLEGQGEFTRDLLGLILEADARNEITEKELVDQCMTFLIAGHETTASALQWIIVVLSQHPEAVEKIRHELHGKELTYETLRNSKYLNAVVKEVLRLYPPVPIVSRQALEDVEVQGFRIPKNTLIVIPPAVIHMLEENFDHAEEFIPERWLREDNPAKASNFLSFNIGGHNCIGQRFAFFELLVLVSVLYTRFNIQATEERYRKYSRVTMKPSPELFVRVSVAKEHSAS
uniref:Cytochrome P450 n=1 Tax=Rhodosorus marinus TaxID=101924 RepID=A0A7S3E6C8_9RHOD|mmetsp:Transcript_11482/g.47781  ORF Transcript_11482/g.47781 Transcript_11482/m.47781 type:complete len:495 (+) Transcript_11482:348-1832(+)|eukprot:CAMPEP_0113968646 /NCGR_PEP_ID=MMETSP0011_2-20120614/9678_1 /TAXON_ID=101924 /ORGANISM="Rhodosorus marinus" /LENGTH=494 /DNA_ID=CAMNT_0000981817 /DNA_START=152 /DNA_END=1636 /DNA_ORIENTATION=+ /assembly_acc=CAM_ASM_000156